MQIWKYASFNWEKYAKKLLYIIEYLGKEIYDIYLESKGCCILPVISDVNCKLVQFGKPSILVSLEQPLKAYEPIVVQDGKYILDNAVHEQKALDAIVVHLGKDTEVKF